jgi:phosphinothricin acetyltransferase
MAPDDITLRPVRPSDLEAITAIYAEAVRSGTSTYELDPPDLAEMTARFEAQRTYGYPAIVAESAAGVLGYAYAGPFRARPAYRFMVEDSIYLAPTAQRLGLGLRLLQRLIAECEALGFRQMLAVIGDGRADSGSVRLHARAGFVHSGRIAGSGYKHGRWLDTVLMQLALKGGNGLPPDPGSLPERRFRKE